MTMFKMAAVVLILCCIFLRVWGDAKMAAFPSVLSKKQHQAASHNGAVPIPAYESFQHVFGDDQMRAHFLTKEEFNHSLSRAKLLNYHYISAFRVSSEEEVAHNYVACGAYRDGRALKLQLAALEGISSVATTFTSESEGRACFTVTASSAALRAIDFTAAPLWTLDIVPKALKVHHSVIYGLGLGSAASPIPRTAPAGTIEKEVRRERMQHAYSQAQADLLRSFLVVSSNKERHSLSSFSSASSLRPSRTSELFGLRLQHLLAHDSALHTSLSLLSGDTSLCSESSFWTSALHFSAADKASSRPAGCAASFARLKFDSSALNRVSISNLQSIYEEIASAVGGDRDSKEVEKIVKQRAQSCLVHLLAVLAADPETIDVRFRHAQRRTNNLIKGIVQAKSRTQDYPYLNHGLDGTDQVLGLADTGVDEYSCFFSHGDGTVVARSDYTAPTFDLSRRKVIQYIDFRDGTDGEEGHGTHCCGSMLGMTSDPSFVNHSGHAQGAKLAFFDMENAAGFGFSIPIEDMLNCAYVAGAKVSSNSYGGMSNEYNDDTVGVDAFSNAHDDYLAIFSAGNEGNEGYYSLSGASIAKNSVGVGASESIDSGDIGNVAFFSSIGPTFDNRIKPDVVAPGYEALSSRSSGTAEASCDVAAMSGTSMSTPAVAGVAAQIRQYFEDPSFWSLFCLSSPSELVRGSSLCTEGAFSPRGASVKAMLVHSGEAMTNYHSPVPYCYGYVEGEDGLADGCASYLMVRPNYGDCVTCKAGYEINVYYQDCSGWCVLIGESEHLPSESTCEQGEGYTNEEAMADTREPGAVLAAPPDMYQGFGRVSLLNMPGVQEDIQLFVHEFDLSAMQETSLFLTFAEDQSQPLKVTIAWMDPTNEVYSAKMLLHDIDLIVEQTSGGEGSKWFGNMQAGDERNNVEQIMIMTPSAGDYKVSLVSKVFTESDNQKVSLIITAGELVGTGPTTAVAIDDDFVDNELSCAAGEAMLTVNLLDNFGDGWQEGCSIDIRRESDDVVVWSSTMEASVPRDAYVREVVCIPDGEYSAVMVQTGDDSYEMGVEIDNCFVHLSATVLSAHISIVNGTCNACSDTVVTLHLTGSPYSIPYGWKGDTQYLLTSYEGRTEQGRLVMGINMDQRVCLANGEYHLVFDGVADEDDWIDDSSYLAPYTDSIGIGEYRILVQEVNTGSPHSVEISTTEALTIRVHNSAADIVWGSQPFSDSPSGVPSVAPSGEPSVSPTFDPSASPSLTTSSTPSHPGTTHPPSLAPITVVSFTTNMDMNGIQTSDSDEAAKEAFCEITADGIEGVSADDISDVVGMEIATEPYLLRAAAGGGVAVSFTVTAVEENMPGSFSNTTALVDSIETDMIEHFNDEATATSFVDLSVSKGSSMPSDSVVLFEDPVVDDSSVQETVVNTPYPTQQPSAQPSGQPDTQENADGDELDRGISIVTISAGAFAGVLVIVLVAGLIFSWTKKTPTENAKGTGADISGIDKHGSTENPLNQL